MKYLFLSDIHSNIEALKEVKRVILKLRPDKVLCGGDIVGYGPSPQECIEVVREISNVCIAGNHDWAVCGKENLDYFYSEARQVIEWTRSLLNESQYLYLDSLSLMHLEEDFILVHGTLDRPEKFNYLIDAVSAQRTFACMDDKNITFLGHTHVPFVLIQRREGGRISLLSTEREISIKDSFRYIINIGSVGQPRDHDPRGCTCIYDTENKVVKFIRFQYNIKITQRKIRRYGLPSIFAQRLERGE